MNKPELKTLNDIFPTDNDGWELENQDARGDLKQAAIEWYKELNWTNIIELPDGDFIYEGEEVRKFIKHFFNLTDEELNDARNRIE